MAVALTQRPGVFIANADGSLVIASSQHIVSEFHALSDASWLVTSHVLAQCASQPLVSVMNRPSESTTEKTESMESSAISSAGSIISSPHMSSSLWDVSSGECTRTLLLATLLKFWYSSVGKVYWQVLAGRAISGIGGAGMTALVSIIKAGIFIISQNVHAVKLIVRHGSGSQCSILEKLRKHRSNNRPFARRSSRRLAHRHYRLAMALLWPVSTDSIRPSSQSLKIAPAYPKIRAR